MRSDVTSQAPAELRHRRRADLLGIAFVLLATAVAGYAMRDQLPEIADAAATIGWWRLLVALALVVAGLYATGEGWRRCMAALGAPVSPAAGRSIFFPAQVGKYIPGSVWTFLAQARNARRHGVPTGTALLAGTVFLAVHMVTALPVAGLALLGDRELLDRFGATLALALLALVPLHPRVLNAVVSRLPMRAGTERPPALGWSHLAMPLAWMAPAWAAYGAAGTLLAAPFGDSPLRLALLCTGAFGLGWLVGVLVVFAPAGVGAREAVLVLVLTPALGVAAATSVALLLRVCHTLADVALGVRYGLGRRASERQP